MMLFSMAARRSTRKHFPPNVGSFLSTKLSDYTATHMKRPVTSYSSNPSAQGAGNVGARKFLNPLFQGVGGLRHVELTSSPPKLLSGFMSQRSFWGRGKEWYRSSKNESSSWMRPRRNTILGSFGSSRISGGGSFVDPQLALGALIATNVGVFFLWRTLGGPFMQSNFVVSAQAIREGRLHTLVTSAFSQYELHHLLSNMLGLYFFGSEIGNLFGGQRLILLYLTGGVVGSLIHMAYWTYMKPWAEGYPRRFSQYSPGLLGSSGAVNAIILLDILLFPTRIIYFNLIIPIPAALFGVVIIGSDLWAATDGNRHGTSPAAHLGGAVVGALAWLRWR